MAISWFIPLFHWFPTAGFCVFEIHLLNLVDMTPKIA